MLQRSVNLLVNLSLGRGHVTHDKHDSNHG
jgi:hypothetical protein